MALGDFIQTIFNQGGAPGINATRLNNIGSKVKELDTEVASLTLPATLLAKIKEVDGTISGLDSDMVDGVHASNIIFGDTSAGAIATVNPDDTSKSGFYYRTVGGPGNAPAFVFNLQISSDYAFQIAMTNSFNTSTLTYVRHKNSGTWTAWKRLFNSDNDGANSGLETDKIPFGTKTGTSTGTQGQASFDANYLYLCTATNIWKRVALTAF